MQKSSPHITVDVKSKFKVQFQSRPGIQFKEYK
jgi:hypothetical protein